MSYETVRIRLETRPINLIKNFLYRFDFNVEVNPDYMELILQGDREVLLHLADIADAIVRLPSQERTPPPLANRIALKGEP